MKKLLYLLFAVTLFTACSSDDDNDNSPKQEKYTSFIVTIDSPVMFENCIAAYKKENKFYKLGVLGTITKGTYSPEIKITDKSITDIYIFSDYNGVIMFKETYKLTIDKKNTIVVANGTAGIVITDKTDPTQYPQ